MKRNIGTLFSKWKTFTRKLVERIENPRFVGAFTEVESEMRGMRLATGSLNIHQGAVRAKIYFLVDETDGVIADAKFQASGPPSFLGALDGALEFFMRKNYDQVRRISAELLDKYFRDKPDKEAFAPSEYSSLNWVLEMASEAANQCLDIPLSETYVPTPLQNQEEEGSFYTNWNDLSDTQQLAVIEEVIARDIRPYVELDEGGIDVIRFTEGTELVIAYKGACTTCYSSIGATLEAIQQIIATKVHPSIRVVPDSSLLNPS